MSDIKELIKSKLRPIGDAIREKNGSTELIPIDDMPQAIRDIQGGGGGIVEVTELPEVGKANTVYKLVNKIGTAIPTTGTIENYYLNVSLSINEVVDILSQLTYQSGTDANTNVVFQTDNHNIICYQVDGAYAIKADNAYVFASNLTLAERLQCSSIGWNVAFITEDWTPKTPVAVNETILTEEDLGMPIGAENDKVINLFSITPFEEKIPSEMYYLFENSEWQQISGGILEVNNLPTSGEDNYVYKLSQQPTYELYANIEEEGLGVVNLRDYAQRKGGSIELIGVADTKESLPSNPVETTEMMKFKVYYVRNDDLYVYGAFGENDTKIWFSFSQLMEIPFSGEVTSIDEMTVLNSMYVLTIPNEGFDYYMYEVTNPTQVPNSGLIENLYFNTKLSNEEVDNILSQLTYDTDGYAYVVGAYEKGSGYGNIIIVEANAFTEGQIPSGYIIGHMNDTTNMASTEFIYVSNQGLVDLASTMGINTKVGWNMEALNLNQTFNGAFGTENDKLINVISTTLYPRWTKISGGGATVKATPIAVPNTGFVERIYLNKSLTFDEVNAICTKANNLVANELLKANVIACNKDVNKLLAVMKFTDTDDSTFNEILYPDLATVIWSEKDYYHVGTSGTITQFKKGWNIEENYLEFNDEVVAEANIFTDVTCGTYNDQLTELFSLNGVFETNEIKVSGEYDGTPITVSNMTLQGTEIPTTGTIGTVYCNTSMSVEEVVKVLKTLNYETDGSNEFCSVVVTLDRLIRIIKTGNVYGILDGVMLVFVSESVASTNFVGWNPEYTTISVNQESTLEEGTVLQNDKLKNILSITPFEAKTVNNFNIDIKSLLEEKKLPLEIKLNVESQEPNLQEKEITENGEYVADEGYDGFSKVTVNVESEIKLKPVTNIALSSGGLLTWDAPDTTDIADKLVSISYVVNVNGTELTSDTNSINVIDNVVVGENTVIVKAIVSLYNEETQSVVEYEIPKPEVITLSTTLPSARTNTSAVAIGTNAYIFGGNNTNEIAKFDSVSETITTLTATLSTRRSFASAVAIGTNAYVFGGSPYNAINEILKFDSVSETITTLSTTLPSELEKTSAVAIGTNAYIFGGAKIYSNFTNEILKFDSVSETITTLTATLQTAIGNTSAVIIGNNAYIFGGVSSGNAYHSNTYKFDTTTETITQYRYDHSASSPINIAETSAVAIGTNAYIFGGRNVNVMLNTILKFDSVSETMTTLEIILPSARTNTSAVIIGNNAYIFGGYNGGSVLNEIIKVTNLS